MCIRDRQLLGRGVILGLFVAHVGVQIIPLAFALTSTVETLILGTVLLLKLRARQGAGSMSRDARGD